MQSRRRGRQPRIHRAGPGGVRACGRPHQHRRHRQLGRRRHLRPRVASRSSARAIATARRCRRRDGLARQGMTDHGRRAGPVRATEPRPTRWKLPRSKPRSGRSARASDGTARTRAPGSTVRWRHCRAPRSCRSGTPRDSGYDVPRARGAAGVHQARTQRALAAFDVPDDTYLQADFVAYFPIFAPHRLRRHVVVTPAAHEIVAQVVADAVVHRAGISFLSRCATRPDYRSPPWPAAHVIARDVLDAADTWAAVDALDLAVPAAVRTRCSYLVRRLVERSARWLGRPRAVAALDPPSTASGPGCEPSPPPCRSCWWDRSPTRRDDHGPLVRRASPRPRSSCRDERRRAGGAAGGRPRRASTDLDATTGRADPVPARRSARSRPTPRERIAALPWRRLVADRGARRRSATTSTSRSTHSPPR